VTLIVLAACGACVLTLITPPFGLMACETIAVLFLAAWDSFAVQPSTSLLTICWARLVAFATMHINFALIWASSCWQEGFTIWRMHQVVVKHAVWAVRWALIIALSAVVAFFASVAFATTSANTFWTFSTIFRTFFGAPQTMPFAVTSLAFAVLVRDTMHLVFGTIIFLASRRHIAISAQVTPVRTAVFGTFQVTSETPLEFVFTLAAMQALKPDLVLASANI